MPSESRPAGIQSSLLSPLLPETESPFDLEQQWQDLMSIMEMQVSSRRGRAVGPASGGGCCQPGGILRGVCGEVFVLPGARFGSAAFKVASAAVPAPDSRRAAGWG